MKRKQYIIVLAALLVVVAVAIVWWWRSRPSGLSAPIALIDIPPGEFIMGSPETEVGRELNETQHRVRITYAFKMGKYEVTQKHKIYPRPGRLGDNQGLGNRCGPGTLVVGWSR